jgi:hypothetical protein
MKIQNFLFLLRNIIFLFGISLNFPMVLNAQWDIPAFPALDSSGNIIDKCGFDPALSRLQLEILGDHWGYGYDSLLVDLPRWGQSSYVQIDSLGASVQNRAIWQLTITSNGPPVRSRRTIFIHARTHPGEVQSWWVTREIINYLLSEEDYAHFLRENCVFYILPMYNPDGVELEYPRQNANGVDLESNWNTNPVQPEVAVLRNRFASLMSSDAPIEIALNMHSSVSCTRYFVYHSEVGTSVNYALLERNYIEGVRYWFYDGIEPWDYYISWTTGMAIQYPESWFWLNHGEAVMALTYEDMNCTSAGDFDQTAYALLHGSADYLGLINTAVTHSGTELVRDEMELQNFPNPISLANQQDLSTVVQYHLKSSQDVRLVLYDILGRQLTVLDQGYRSADEHRLIFNAGHLPNGIYFFALETATNRIIKRFSVIR